MSPAACDMLYAHSAIALHSFMCLFVFDDPHVLFHVFIRRPLILLCFMF